jgi:hypothetical protein
MPTQWTFACKHRAEIETADYFNVTKKTSLELCPDCKELRLNFPEEVRAARQMCEERIVRQLSLHDFLQDKLNKALASGNATFKLTDRESMALGLGRAFISERLREWSQPELDVAKVALADWVGKSPQETYHFDFTPLKSSLLEARSKVKLFKEADEVLLRFETTKDLEQQDEEKLEDLKLRVASWGVVEAELSQFHRTLKNHRQNGMSLDQLEPLFQTIVEKAEKLIYPEITSEQGLAASEMQEVCQAPSAKLKM